jgi:hypothetical protein
MLVGAYTMGHRIARRILAATALLSVVIAAAATGGTWLRCRMTGVLLPACCCPDDAAADEGTPAPVGVEADACCDRVVTSVDQVPSETASRYASSPPALSAWSIEMAVDGAQAGHAAGGRIEQSRAGPPTTRAFLLSKSSLLL